MKQKQIKPLQREIELSSADEAYSVGDDFFLIDHTVLASSYDRPFRLDVMVAVVCTRGCMKGRINLEPCVSQASSVTVLLPGQLLEYEQISRDFAGFFLIMSKPFADRLMMSMQERMSLSFAFADNPCLSLSGQEMESILDYCDLLKKTRRIDDLSVRREMVIHLTMAFYYVLIYRSHLLSAAAFPPPSGQHTRLLNRFMQLVGEHFRERRDIKFYADRLCLTPKYLSKIIRDSSGASAGEWIDRHVVFEARALLQSTGMTVRQISDALNFPSQSFFGRYFKRLVGVSPKVYRSDRRNRCG